MVEFTVFNSLTFIGNCRKCINTHFESHPNTGACGFLVNENKSLKDLFSNYKLEIKSEFAMIKY